MSSAELALDRHEETAQPRWSARGRVLMLFQPRVGGVPQYVANLSEGLAGRGWEVVVAGPSDTPVRERLTACAEVHSLDAGTEPSPSDLRLAARLAALCRRRRVDLIHAHSSKAGALAAGAGVLSATPSIYTPHAWSFQRQQSRPKHVAYVTAERVLMRRHSGVVAVAEVERTEAIAHRIVAPERIELIETGLPDATLPEVQAARAELGIERDEFVVAWVGRLGPQKRIADLADLGERLGDRARLVVLGYGVAESEIGQVLAARGAIVRSTGPTSTIYAAADALVVTSRWEASPVVVLEAMRAGLPVVAYDVGGICDQVEHRDTGLLVDSGDVAALAAHLHELAHDPGYRLRMGSAARRRFEQRFRADRMVERIEARYAGVLSAGSGR